MLASCEVVKLGRADPIAWKAVLLGAKIVTSLSESTASTRSACFRAPAIPLNPAAIAVVETFSGTVNTVSIM